MGSINKSNSPGPSVFLSHDSRDSEIAVAFSNLLQRVSAGILKCFFSSDKNHSGGVAYGDEWYPEIVGQIRKAVHVICLLTDRSMGRPWILYEAGIAKGINSHTVTGLMIGAQMNTASAGPFGHFQNCGSDEGSLVKLILQLLKQSLEHSEPDRRLITREVRAFRREISKIQERDFKSKNADNRITNGSEGVINFVETMGQNVVKAINVGGSCFDGGDNVDKFVEFLKNPAAHLEAFFNYMDMQFSTRISPTGKLIRLSKPIDFSSAALVSSLLELGLPLSLSLHVPSMVINFLEIWVKDATIFDEVTSSHIRTAVVRSFDLLQANPEFLPDRIEITRTAYLRRYGNPDNQYLKVIDHGHEKDLNYGYIVNEIIPHALKRILQTSDDPLTLYKEVFTNSRIREMANEIMAATSQLNLYSIRYKVLLYLVQDIIIQPPHPWLVSKDTEARILEYNLERMEAHYQSISESLLLDALPSMHFHHLNEFFQHGSAAILSKYGAYLGVGTQYGLTELNRTLGLKNSNITLWHYCRLGQIGNDLEKIQSSLYNLKRSAKKVQQQLQNASSNRDILANPIRPEVLFFRRIASGLADLA